MRVRPLLAFTVCWVFGSSLACLLSGISLWAAWAGCSLCLPLLQRLTAQRMGLVLMCWLSLTLSALYWEWTDSRNSSELPGQLNISAEGLQGSMVHVTGALATGVEVDGDKAQFRLRLQNIQLRQGPIVQSSELVLIQIKLNAQPEQKLAQSWRRGDVVRLTGELQQPARAGNFGGFDYRKYLRTQRIHWLLKGAGASNLQMLKSPSWSRYSLLRLNDGIRASLSESMNSLFEPKVNAGYMKGLVLGITDDYDPEQYRHFTLLGLTHILAISGMHVAVYVAVLHRLFLWLRFSRERSLLLIMLLVPVYVLLSGASPSVVRAGIMSIIGLYALRKGVLRDGMNILSAAALIMLLIEPYFLLNVSFQLSFLVTAGLIVYVPLLQPLLSRLPIILRGSIAVTVAAQMVSFPLTIYYFNQFSILSLAANFILVPFITFLVLPLGAAALLVSWVWLDGARGMAWLAERLNTLTFAVVQWMNGYESFRTVWASPSLLWIFMYYVMLYMLFKLFQQWHAVRNPPTSRWSEEDTVPLIHSDNRTEISRGPGVRSSDLHPAAAGSPEWSAITGGRDRLPGAGTAVGRRFGLYQGLALVLSAIILFAMLNGAYSSSGAYGGRGIVQFLDIGQGDSILITTPAGRHLLVDGGGTIDFGKPKDTWRQRRDPYEVGAKTLVPLLQQRGVHQLDAVIATHGDADHIGGLQAVLDTLPVKKLVFNGTLTGKDKLDRLIETALDKHIPLYQAEQGMGLTVDKNTRLEFIFPGVSEQTSESSVLPIVKEQNPLSLAFRLDMEGGSYLFTGDMDIGAETQLLGDIRTSGQKNQSGDSSTALSARLMYSPVDVLKVAHHGSKSSTSADWLEFWRPKASVISAGKHNLYGHPNADALKRLGEAHSQVYRTDTMGEIQMQAIDGKVKVRTMYSGDK
ncbi:ComEC/Rec2 family competence protein [Paenibacillus sp. JX-17]|uniref:ComEC/Rec2 family competence protein n=1 Tax=Paenibacillus lacisoli TaxID=3064525 RepID=A0ABT9C8B9_9BACL|nr:ComEC/Rec2 family competence protein [Paenibacillus sp. JX-17]MDO7905496.1 ComEC/Rec2 family competence protein [Paenibacillus sp. JX-17]